MLRRRAERRLDREGALPVCFHKVGRRAVDAAQRAVLGLAHDAAYRAGITLEVLFHFLEHRDARFGALQLDRKTVRPLGKVV